MVKPIAQISVVPNLPKPLERLQELAYNLRWAWDYETMALFRRLDRDLWETTYHNPVRLLGTISQEKLDAAQNDPSFMAHFNRVCQSFDEFMTTSDTWYNNNYGHLSPQPTIAYFSMEFGITECLQNYSGGLGVLSGDHLKSANDLGIPLIGVGLLYQEGYFRQYLNADGYQQESYPINDYANLPVMLQRDANGDPIKISVRLPGRDLYAVIWKMQVGRVPLYLLDSNIDDNPNPEDRNLTDRLYGGDRRTRIRQEILMGIGGIRALEALGLRPTICHMNEGHSAFLALERVRILMNEQQLGFRQAAEIAAAGHVFTTHTPVAAGLERFGFDLIDEHFTDYWKALGLTRDEFLDLGREKMGDYDLFSMPVLALRLSSAANAVAKLHGVVSRKLWDWVYPGVPENEIPVESITNGIHVRTWISYEMETLLDRYLNPTWKENDSDANVWKDVDLIPDSELWRTHSRRRERLVAFARERVKQHLYSRGAVRSDIEQADEILNPEALTIGFARRFATYKRATLLFRDLERLKRILNDAERPVQIIFAGKAHPHDTAGKELIRQIINVARTEDFRHALVFLEDYDMNVARYLVQGVDVWLNTPRRPKEASGTSGMKVIYNGGLNCSVLDGWWAEAYTPDVGWAIGNGEEYPDYEADHQDYIESQALYNILEKDIIPLFYDRGRDGLPREWIRKVKNSMRTLAPYFTTRRMVEEYTTNYYVPCYKRELAMTKPDLSVGVDFAAWRQKIEANWHQVEIRNVNVPQKTLPVGTPMVVEASVALGNLSPDDVRVQLYYGPLTPGGEISRDGKAVDMLPISPNGHGEHKFAAQLTYDDSGARGVSVRVLPKSDLLMTPFLPGIITWAK